MSLEAIRDRAEAERWEEQSPCETDRRVLLGLLDEAVELLTEWDNARLHQNDDMTTIESHNRGVARTIDAEQALRAFLARLGRDQ